MSKYSVIIDPLLSDARKRVAEVSGAGPGKRVLDVCSGTGDQVFYYARTGAEAVGVDKRPGMIAEAKSRKARERLENASFKKANAVCLPFADNFFDVVSVSLGLHEMEREERSAAASEMKRVVNKNGVLIFVDFISPLPKDLPSFLLRTVEYLAGRKNYESFKDYLAEGGLPIIIKKHKLNIESSEYLNSFLCLIKAKKI